MIKIAFEALTLGALNALIADYMGGDKPAAAPPADKPAKPPKADPAPKAEAQPPAAPPTAVSYDQIVAQVPKTMALGVNAKAKVNALMAEWGVDPGKGKKVKDVVPAEKYGEFLAALSAIDNG